MVDVVCAGSVVEVVVLVVDTGQPLPSVSGSRVVATHTDYQLDTLGGLASAEERA